MKEKLKTIVSELEKLKDATEEDVLRLAWDYAGDTIQGLVAARTIVNELERRAAMVALSARTFWGTIDPMVKSLKEYVDGERSDPPVAQMLAILVAIDAAAAAASSDTAAMTYFNALKAKLADLGILDVADEMWRS